MAKTGNGRSGEGGSSRAGGKRNADSGARNRVPVSRADISDVCPGGKTVWVCREGHQFTTIGEQKPEKCPICARNVVIEENPHISAAWKEHQKQIAERNRAAQKENWKNHKKRKEAQEREATGYWEGLFAMLEEFWPILFLVMFFVWWVVMIISGLGEPQSTVAREKIDTGIAWQAECIVDELGWVKDVPQTTAGLKSFYDKTGIQPFVYLKAYDASVTTEAARNEFIQKWFQENPGSEGTLLYIYFAARNQNGSVGDMYYEAGELAAAFMDEEAGEIFAAYMKTAWSSEKNTDEMLVSVFNDTADRAMTESSDPGGLFIGLFYFAIAAVVVAVLIYSFFWFAVTNGEQAELQEKEMQLLMDTPLDVMAEVVSEERAKENEDDTEVDSLLKKYLHS